MKRLLFFPALFLSTMAFASSLNPVQELNEEIQKILLPFQNEKTEARLTFAAIETDAVRALSAKLSGIYKKIGNNNQLEIALNDLSYNYGNGTAPTTNVNLNLNTDLTKILSQDDINDFIPGLEQTIIDAAKGFTEEYGEAISLTVAITDKTQDENGNYTAIAGSILFNIDLAKLPEGKLAQDVPVLSGNAAISVQVKNGIQITATVISNPQYTGFQENNQGLKEILEKLLAKDAETLDQFRGLFQQLEDFAKQILGE
jgi:hypothetical protein